MAIETLCQTCGSHLRVGDEHAGKMARCPSCQTVYTVPRASAIGAAAGPLPLHSPPGRWHLKTPDGLTYGPVPRGDLDQWQREGRITAQSQVMEESDGRWLWAGQLYPQLPSMAADARSGHIFSDGINPYSPPGYAYYGPAPASWQEPHRGPVVLALGILGLLFCGLLSWGAVILGIIDLNKMARGTMDPGGRALTIVGLVVGGLSVLMQVIFIAAAIAGLL